MPTASLGKRTRTATPKSAAKPYHHGDLRAALIAAARGALETLAPEDISLKALAIQLGVTQPAPYRHFADREALFTAVAVEGFQECCMQLSSPKKLSPRQEFLWGCDAYMSFAGNNRGLYRLMFASRLLKRADGTEVGKLAGESFTILLDRVRRCSGAADAELNAVWVWATLHGLAMLDAEEITAAPLSFPLTTKQVVRQLADSLMHRKGRNA